MLSNFIKYLIYVSIEINNKWKYIYNYVRLRMGSAHMEWEKTALISVIWGIVMSYPVNLAHGTIIITYE